MNTEDIRAINRLFEAFYPFLARQIADVYGREGGLALEIGPYGPGISIELAKLYPRLSIVVGDDSPDALAYLREAVRAASLGERIEVKEVDKFDLPFPEATFDLVVFRGALFFWEDEARILREIYRVLKPGGVGVAGGGFGAETPEELIEVVADEVPELNRRLGKKTLSDVEVNTILEEAGVADRTEIERRHGLWLVVRKQAFLW